MGDGVPRGHLGAAQQQLAGERGTVQCAGVEYGMCRPGGHDSKLALLADTFCPQLHIEGRRELDPGRTAPTPEAFSPYILPLARKHTFDNTRSTGS
ncbi:hypothetical protein Slala04_06650 [Streptomyces lavendulae subsp. lavendulae]|nr:hypothetical protein Slala04_06650 [Streptomyces lavendulae subsp. lavendulae]